MWSLCTCSICCVAKDWYLLCGLHSAFHVLQRDVSHKRCWLSSQNKIASEINRHQKKKPSLYSVLLTVKSEFCSKSKSSALNQRTPKRYALPPGTAAPLHSSGTVLALLFKVFHWVLTLHCSLRCIFGNSRCCRITDYCDVCSIV
jgi:hypothetical protein